MFNNLNKYWCLLSFQCLHDGITVVKTSTFNESFVVEQNPFDPWRQIVACPKCDAEFEFSRSIRPHIDECGFESYDLHCVTCSAPLHGIIDPADDKLLLSET